MIGDIVFTTYGSNFSTSSSWQSVPQMNFKIPEDGFYDLCYANGASNEGTGRTHYQALMLNEGVDNFRILESYVSYRGASSEIIFHVYKEIKNYYLEKDDVIQLIAKNASGGTTVRSTFSGEEGIAIMSARRVA